MKRSTALIAGVLGAGVAAMAGSAAAQSIPAVQAVSGPVVSLSVTESVESVPDMATVSTGVQTKALTAKQAMAANATQMDKLVAALVGAGVERRDIQTSGINLNAQYDYSSRKDGEGPRFLGYEASNQLTVKLRDIKKVGEMIDKMVGAGATNINGPSFGILDDTALLQQARTKVIKAAGERAAFYAQAAGYRAARLIAISETGDVSRPIVVTGMRQMAMEAAAPMTKIEPGQLSTSVTLGFQYVLER
jgi:hypothetical protein